MDHNIFLKNLLCSYCNNNMKYIKSRQKKDGVLWICKKDGINKHDT